MIFPCFTNRVKAEQKFSMSSQTGDGEGGLKTILSAAATPREEHLKIGHCTKKGSNWSQVPGVILTFLLHYVIIPLPIQTVVQ